VDPAVRRVVDQPLVREQLERLSWNASLTVLREMASAADTCSSRSFVPGSRWPWVICVRNIWAACSAVLARGGSAGSSASACASSLEVTVSPPHLPSLKMRFN
jgi:hypothetical protein